MQPYIIRYVIENMKVFRIAILVGGICGLLILLIFGYEILISNNTGVLERMGEIISPPLLGIFLFCLFVFVFISNLVLFPYYLFRSIPFVILINWRTPESRKKLNENINSLTGLFICSIVTLILVAIGGLIK